MLDRKLSEGIRVMMILALDPATATGFCRGLTDTTPKSGAIDLRPKGAAIFDVPHNYYGFLNDVNLRAKPDLVVYEAPLTMAAIKSFNRPQNEETARMPFYLEATLWLWCSRNEVDVRSISSQTYRKHCLGFSSVKDDSMNKDQRRFELKRLMLNWAKLLGYIAKDRYPTRNDATDPLYDVADACGLWDYAAATWGKRVPKELFMVGERA
jgi:hypothetical protein